MDRRDFIRLTSAGSTALVAATGSACSQQMPENAVAAWKGLLAERDVRR
jgi:hypothetical protein